MRSKAARSVVSLARPSKSRREFLRYGAVAAGTSLLAPLWPRWASAQTVATYDYYISTSGSDSNAGTQAAPWAITSLLPGSANRTKMAGKRVGVLPGTYSVIGVIGGSTNNSFGSPVLDVPPGSAASPTILQSTVPLGAIIDGGLTDTNAPSRPPLLGHVNPGDGYYTIDGFEVRNANDRLISVGGGTAAGSNPNCLGVTVKNCFVHGVTSTSSGANSTGITLYACSGALVQNNYVTGIVNSNNRNSGIETWSTVNSVIEYNTVVMSNAGASPIYIKNAGQRDMTVRYNYVDTTGASSLGGSGAVAWDLGGTAADTSSLHNNIFVTAQPFQVGIMTGGPNSTENQQIYNNTFVGTPNWSTGGVRPWGAAGVLTHYNNIYQRGAGGGGGRGDLDVNASELTLSDYNLFPASPSLGVTPDGSTAYPTLYSALATWGAALPPGCVGKDAHSMLGAPSFAGGSPVLPAYKYQLASGSAGMGAGRSNGQSSGSMCDMGAWGGATPPTQIGCSFSPGLPVPNAPVLSVS